MMILKVILLALEIIVSILMIGVILLQKSRAEGLGMAFGASMGESLFGSRAGNVLTKITIVLGSVFLVNTVVLAKLYSGTQGTSVSKSLLENAEAAPMAAPMVPGAPGPDSGAAVNPGLTTLPVAPIEPAPAPVAPVEPAPAPVAPVEPAPAPVAPVAQPDESPAAQ